METESLLPKPTYGGIKRYFRRRRYQRLDGDNNVGRGRKKTKVVRLRRSPRRHFRMKSVPKLTWMVIRSPLKMLAKVKNSYMKLMLRWMNTESMFGQKRIAKVPEAYNYKSHQFEARLIFEISKALVASHELYSM
ncbi:hypothetical protein Fmac_017109 [Flemingia macrophylla]|uniref:Uncharacterized protein n=1 Tax=Flemingia macrophylla TaxID=520843 RepID=A0ABD1M173_9FABA